jgi:hypothetical protein
MTLMACLLWGVLGGLWRRIFGGWLSLPRGSVCYPLSIPLSAPLGILFWQLLPWYFAIPAFLAAAGLVLLFFIVSFYPKGKFTDDRDVMLRYGPFGYGYVLAHKYWKDEWNELFNKPFYKFTTTKFIDGSNAVGEISLGASFFSVVGIAWYWIL